MRAPATAQAGGLEAGGLQAGGLEAGVWEAAVGEVGAQLPDLVVPLSGELVARFAEASGDPNPIHLSDGAARAAGLPGQIAHGMLALACLGRLVTACVPGPRLRGLRASFVAPVPVGDVLTCQGTVSEVTQEGGQRLARIRLSALRGDGKLAVRGQAVVLLPRPGSATPAFRTTRRGTASDPQIPKGQS